MGQRDEISRRVISARFGEGLIGQRLLGQLVEHVKDILRGVDVRIGQAGQVAERVIAVEVGVVRRVGMVELDDSLQLVGGVVGVLDRLRRPDR